MKRKMKRLTAVFLSVLMLFSSVPLTAFGSDADLVALNNAISAYEKKMNGTVYNNMSDAYEKYVTAREYAYAYEYGKRTDLDLNKAADELSAASVLMTPWAPETVNNPAFNYGNAVPSDYIQNVIYRSAPTVFGGMAVEAFKYKFLMPKNVVFLYDGTDLKLPVMVAANNNGIVAIGNDRAPLSFFPNDNTPNTLSDNEYFRLPGQWKGYYALEQDGGPTAASDFNWSSAMNGSDKIFGYDNESNSQCDAKSNRGEQIKTGSQKIWRQYSNYLVYQKSAYAKGWTNGLQTVSLSWTGRNMRWTNFFTGATELNDYHYYYGTADSEDRFEAKFYIIDYSKVKSTLETTGTKLLNLAYNEGTGKADNLYVKDELATVFETVEALQADPTAGFTDANYAERAAEIASDIQKNITALNNAVVSKSDIEDYDALGSLIKNSTAIYEYNNADGKYTAESFATFKAAYDAAASDAGKVADDGFTAVTTAVALEKAYKGLNVVTESNGTSGSTTYTYDEDTGVVEVTGPGAMADYESGDESTFGNNDKIKEVVIADDVTYIGAHAFAGDNNLITITVPAAATYGEGAFDGCNKLATVIIINGEVTNDSAANAPWQRPSVHLIKLGENENDLTVSAIDNDVFTNMNNTAFYIYNPECTIPSQTNATLGTNPTIYGYIPSTAMDYAKKFNFSFVSLGHEHVWIADTVVEPACTSGGYTLYKCKYEEYCNVTKKDDFTSALGHKYNGGSVVAPKCTEKGYTLLTCTVCGYEKKSAYTPALGHSFNEGNYEPAYPTGAVKDDNSNVVYKHQVACSRECGEYQSKYCSFKITGTETEGSDSFVIFTCSVCGGTYKIKSDAKADEYNVFYFGTGNQLKKVENVKAGEFPKEVPALTENTPGHTYSWTLDGVTIDPTTVKINAVTAFQEVETVEDFTVSYYDADGAFISAEKVYYGAYPASIPDLPDDVTNVAEAGHYVYIWKDNVNPAEVAVVKNLDYYIDTELLTHHFTDTVVLTPSCTEDGYMSRYCDDCGYSINRVDIAAVGHQIVVDKAVAATCTKSGLTEGSHCSVCHTVITAQQVIPAAGHKWNTGVITVQPTINAEGKKVYTCSVCKETKTEVIPKLTVADITPSDKEANAAPVNKTINRPKKVKTTSFSKKKQMRIRFEAIAGAQNYRIQYRTAGAKKWSYAWTDGKTEYYLKKLKNGGLYEFRFAAYKKNANGKWERGNYSKITRRYYYKHSLKSAKAGKQSITLKWKKKKGATSYQIQYSLKKSMKGAKTITLKDANITSYVIPKLKKGKTYYVRIRANKKSGKNTFTGEYSKRLKVKVSK